jgi:hypothetical protein
MIALSLEDLTVGRSKGRRICLWGNARVRYALDKKRAAVAAVHWPESTQRQRMGWPAEEAWRVANVERQIKITSSGAGVGEGSRAGSASYAPAHLARASIGNGPRGDLTARQTADTRH